MRGEDIVYWAGEKYWDVEQTAYVSEPPPGKEVVELTQSGQPADEAYLIRTLRFYGFPLGELTEKDAQGLQEKLAALDAKYLTPRVLAGLATGDAYAAEMWREHEAAAKPFRQKLAEKAKAAEA